MSEIQNEVTKTNIRSQLNLIYAMSRLLTTILDMASDNQIAREMLLKVGEGVFEQAAVLCRDIGQYTSAVSDDG